MFDVITRSRYVTLAAYGTCFCGFMLYMGEPPSPKEPEKQQQHVGPAPTPVEQKGSADYQSPFKTYERETAPPPPTPAPTPVNTPPAPKQEEQKEPVKPAPPPPPKILELSNDDDAPTINMKKSKTQKYDFQD